MAKRVVSRSPIDQPSVIDAGWKFPVANRTLIAMQQSEREPAKCSAGATRIGRLRPSATFVLVTLLLLAIGVPPAHAQWRFGAIGGAGVSLLSGADWRDDLAIDDAEEYPALGARAALHAGYRFLPWLAVRLSFSTLRASSRYEYVDDLDGETYEYDGSLSWWSGGPGAQAELRIPIEPVEPYLSLGAIGSFPFSRFVPRENSDEVSIVRRIPAERSIVLHVSGEAGVRFPVGPITALAGIHYERSLTRYFDSSAWPRLYANVLTLNAGVEIPLEGSQ